MRYPLIIIGSVLAAGCTSSSTVLPLDIEGVPLRREVSAEGITCILEGEYPRVREEESRKNVDSLNEILHEAINDAYVTGFQDCPALYLDMTEQGSPLTETTQFGFHVELNEQNLLSITHFATHYLEGAAHPTNVLHALTLDVPSGEEYDLASLFRSESPYQERITAIVERQMAMDDIEASPEAWTNFDEWVFYFRPGYLIMGNFFNIHALQAMQVAISLDEFTDIAREGGPIMRLLEATPST